MSAHIRLSYDGDANLAPIVIILQKSGCADDKLVIRPARRSMNFDVEFTQNTIGTRSDTQIAQSELYSYIERFLSVIYYDIQRCHYVQIDVPGYTSVMLNSTEVGAYMNTLYYQLQSLNNCWPYEVVGRRIHRAVYHAHEVAVPAPVPAVAAAAAPAPAPEFTSTAVQTEERPKRGTQRVTRSMVQRTAH